MPADSRDGTGDREPPASSGEVLRIGSCSGFYGDRFSAVREMLTGGPLDVLVGDYLAELTMLILGKDRMRDPKLGYARTFLRQLEDNLGSVLDRGVLVVANAGGLNPEGLAHAIRELADRWGLAANVAHVAGDDLRDRAAELGFGDPLTANAYLGAWGIAECVESGADIIVTGRVTDASLVVGPAAARFGWARGDDDALAGAVVAGHILECGTHATGGNFSRFTELSDHDLTRPGFPIAEMRPDGSCVITKHPGTGGAVTTGTVTEQLLYEIAGARYAGPDVTTRFDSVRVEQEGRDRVRVSGVRGEPPPPTLKVSLNRLAGYRNEVEFVLTGLDIDAKAELVRRQFESGLADPPAELRWSLVRTDRQDSPVEEEASAVLRCTAKDRDPKPVGRAFSGAAVELALASFPGFHLTAPPGDASPYGVFTAGEVAADEVEHVAVLSDGSRVAVGPPDRTMVLTEVDAPALPAPPPPGPTRRAPLGAVVGARSGDKGGSANVGVWVASDAAWAWLVHVLTPERFQQLLPETAAHPVTRHLFPNLRALNFVVDGLLGEGVAAKARFDPQAKAVGEWLRSRYLDIPEDLL